MPSGSFSLAVTTCRDIKPVSPSDVDLEAGRLLGETRHGGFGTVPPGLPPLWHAWTSFIDVQRRFHDLTEEELEDTESLLAWSEYDFGPAVGWSGLLEDDRVVLLAEAGSGKTMEMIEQAKRLVGEGRFAFFAPLESLDREPIVDLLSVADAKRFGEWKVDGRETAWFFLDAVDELKLVDGKLDRALRGLAKVVDGHTHRARVIISCRPSDWRPHLDLTTVRDRLPVRARRRETPFRSPEEVFLEALRREGRETAGAHRGEEAPRHQGTVRTVAMLPMSDQQIRLFVEEMQRTLAWRIKERANGAYAVDAGRRGSRMGNERTSGYRPSTALTGRSLRSRLRITGGR